MRIKKILHLCLIIPVVDHIRAADLDASAHLGIEDKRAYRFNQRRNNQRHDKQRVFFASVRIVPFLEKMKLVYLQKN